MDRDQLHDIFEPYHELVSISLCGRQYDMPENNTILRGLQYLDVDAISYGEFCWNGECLNCQVWLKNGNKEKAVMACRTNVANGMEIVRVSEPIQAALTLS